MIRKVSGGYKVFSEKGKPLSKTHAYQETSTKTLGTSGLLQIKTIRA